MSTRILVMGLPGSGKTTLATEIVVQLYNCGKTVNWFNATDVRYRNNDQDFSAEGQIRESIRMRELADKSTADFVICDFVAPLQEARDFFDANWIVWVDTVAKSQDEDINNMFVKPMFCHFRVTEKDLAAQAANITLAITNLKTTITEVA